MLRSAIVAVLVLAGCAITQEGLQRRPNVLFLCVDDLRPQLGCDGYEFMQTPHLDSFAARGVRFAHHYVQVPTCGASRRALWTGRLPSARVDLGNAACAELGRDEAKAPATLPGWFRQHGYRTESIGKVSHSPDGRFDPDGDGPRERIPELPDAWDALGCPEGRWGSAHRAFFGYADGTTRRRGVSPPFENSSVDDHGYPDAWIADAAIEALKRLKDGRQPFFLAVGFFKPHLPFTAPESDLARYQPEEVGLSPWPDPPEGVAAGYALHRSGELCRNYGGLPRNGDLSREEAVRVRRAYCAAVTYVDRQIGRLLDALDQAGLGEETIVVVWGDHGWHLGDLGIWGKHTLFDHALRSTLIVRGVSEMEPGVREDVVESIDLFPTLSTACGLPLPDGLDGRDLRSPVAPSFARAAWARNGAVGRSVRGSRYRLTVWRTEDEAVATELYDHEVDPGETRDVSEERSAVVARLTARLPAWSER